MDSQQKLDEPSTSSGRAGSTRQLRTNVNIRPTDKYYEESVEHMLNEYIDDELLLDYNSDDSHIDPDFEISDHDTESEQEMSNDEEIQQRSPTDLQNYDSQEEPANFETEEIRNSHSEGMDTDVPPLNEDTSRQLDDVIENVVLGAGSLPNTRDNFYYGKTIKNRPRFTWSKKPPPQNVRSRAHNIIMKVPTLKAKAKSLGDNPSPLEVFQLLFSDKMIQEILHWTNVKIGELREKYTNKNLSFIQDTNVVELNALIGLLIYTSVFKANNESVLSLYATDGTGRDVFRCTLSKERFLFLLVSLRFDNPNDRLERAKDDRSAAISKLLQSFIENSQECYSMGETACVDEMLVGFRGRCGFRMYMPNKPAKYGLKVMAMTDARTQYLYNAYIYTGKDCYGQGLSLNEKKLNKPTQSVLRLVKPIENSRRNVTGDNWFSSIELVTELQKRLLTYVGTLKKNKTEIPEVFKPNSERRVLSSMYGFNDDLTLLSYVPKAKKAVIMISSMHHGPSDDLSTGKPDIIAFYNYTKGGVDGLDFKCANYSSSRRTQRWPMAIFYTILDVASGVNAFVLYQSFKNTPKATRMDFMKSLASSLVQPHMRHRIDRGRLDRDLVFSIKRIIGMQEEEGPAQQPAALLEKRKTCFYCPPKKRRQTRYPCQKCEKPICLECARKVCPECFGCE